MKNADIEVDFCERFHDNLRVGDPNDILRVGSLVYVYKQDEWRWRPGWVIDAHDDGTFDVILHNRRECRYEHLSRDKIGIPMEKNGEPWRY